MVIFPPRLVVAAEVVQSGTSRRCGRRVEQYQAEGLGATQIGVAWETRDKGGVDNFVGNKVPLAHLRFSHLLSTTVTNLGCQ